MPEPQTGDVLGAPCARVAYVVRMTVSIRGTSGRGESTSASVRAAVSRDGAFACEADGSVSLLDRNVSSQVAECREPAVLMQSIQQKRSPTGCQPTRGSELRRR